MKLILNFLACVVTIIFTALIEPSDTTKDVLQKLSEKLNSYKTLSYKYHRSINYVSENYQSETNGTTFLDFNTSNSILGFRYQLENDQYKMIYNGAEAFHLNKKDRTLKVYYKPKLSDFSSISLFVNSIVTLKNALPIIIADDAIQKTLADTTIDNKTHHLVTFVLENKTLSGLGNFDVITLKRNFYYKFIIDKITFLPLLVIQTNNAEPKDYVLTSFTVLRTNADAPSDLSWYYSAYTTEYNPALEKKLALIKPNTLAPDWQLPYFDSNESVSLSKLKGNVVLLEFWIKNCGYCITSVPKLNTLIEKYKDQGLQIVGINRHDTKEDMDFFYRKHQPRFKTVNDNNGKVTVEYGVDAFPTIVLIDKQGTVLFAGSFDDQQIEELIRTALK